MANEMEKLESIRKKLVAAKQERDKLTGKKEGALETLLQQGYKSVASAEKALVKLGEDADKAAKQLEDMIAAFKEKYPELMEDAN